MNNRLLTLLIDRALAARIRLDPSATKANVEYDLYVYRCDAAGCPRVGFSGKPRRVVDEVNVPINSGRYVVGVEPVRKIRSDDTYELSWEIVP